MSYIRIANKTDEVNRLYLEKLGLSTKRDDDSTIGQFGSGSKFAPIAALRNGWEWINVGKDNLGEYKMQYVAQEDNGINCIYYLYDNEILKPSSFTVDAGVLSWDSEFQIFREAFANALDEFTAFGNEYVVELADEVKYEEGMFAVYLTADPALIDIMQNFNKYFSIEREPLCKFDRGTSIYAPYDYETNFYYKGVLVHSEDMKSIFDYGLTNIVLNEERRVRNTYELNYRVANTLSQLCYFGSDNAQAIYIASELINNINGKFWEWTIPLFSIESYFTDLSKTASPNCYRIAWSNIHGDKIAVPSSLMRYKHQFALRNLEIVEIEHETAYEILRRAGVPCADSVLDDDINYEFISLTGDKKKMFDNALKIVNNFLPSFSHIVQDLRVFIPQGEQDKIYGVANMDKNTVYLSINAFASMEILVSTMIHEYDHLQSGFGDGDNEFRLIADKHIGELVVQLYGGYS